MSIPPIFKSLKFLEAVAFALAGFISIVAPDHAVSAAAILALFVAILKLLGVTPELRLAVALSGEIPPIFHVRAFWEAVAFVIASILLAFRPDLPITAGAILALFLAILSLAGIQTEFRIRNILNNFK